jgi:hypothetical protein
MLFIDLTSNLATKFACAKTDPLKTDKAKSNSTALKVGFLFMICDWLKTNILPRIDCLQAKKGNHRGQ